MPTRGRNVLDLVMTSVPDYDCVTDVLSPEKAAIFTDHNIVSLELATFTKAPTKPHRTVFNYKKADFKGLHRALQAINFPALLTGNKDVNTDWERWKDYFLA